MWVAGHLVRPDILSAIADTLKIVKERERERELCINELEFVSHKFLTIPILHLSLSLTEELNRNR